MSKPWDNYSGKTDEERQEFWANDTFGKSISQLKQEAYSSTLPTAYEHELVFDCVASNITYRDEHGNYKISVPSPEWVAQDSGVSLKKVRRIGVSMQLDFHEKANEKLAGHGAQLQSSSYPAMRMAWGIGPTLFGRPGLDDSMSEELGQAYNMFGNKCKHGF